jgi:hypothetical protein
MPPGRRSGGEIFSHHRRLWWTAESFRPAGLHKTSGSRRSSVVSLFPRTPACHGFAIIAKIKPNRSR